MRVCPNCSREIVGGRKICRTCGSILETDAEDQTTASGAPVEPPEEPPRREDMDAHSVQATPDDRPMMSEFPEDSSWKCPQCGERVPSPFAICWNCQSSRDSTPTDSLVPDPSPSPPESALNETVVEAILVDGTPTRAASRSTQCPGCGSTKMMHGVTIRDQGQGSDGSLKVVIAGNPAALMFKDRRYEVLRADVCGDCGRVDLRVANPAKLYRHYVKSRKA